MRRAPACVLRSSSRKRPPPRRPAVGGISVAISGSSSAASSWRPPPWATAFEERHHTPRRPGHDPRHVLRLWRRRRQERTRRVGGSRVDAVQHPAIEVRCGDHRRAEALDERHRRTLPPSNSGNLLCTAPLAGEERAQERAQHGSRQRRVPGARQAERVGQREHPLSNRDFRQNPIHPVGRLSAMRRPPHDGQKPRPSLRLPPPVDSG